MKKIKHFLHHTTWIVVLDMLAFVFSYLLAFYIRFNPNEQTHLGQQYIDYFWTFIPFCAIASVTVFALCRLYEGLWQYAGLHDLNRIIIANTVTSLMHVGISMIVIALSSACKEYSNRMPFSYYILGGMIQFAITAGIRFANRFIQEEVRYINRKKVINVMLVGTGETTKIVRRQISDDPSRGEQIRCIFTYRDSEIGTLINGIPVIGNLNQFKEHIEKFRIRRVILTDSLMPMSVCKRIRENCQASGIGVQDFSGFSLYNNSRLPFQKLMEYVNGEVSILEDGMLTHFDNGEEALKTIVAKRDVKTISIHDDTLIIELIS